LYALADLSENASFDFITQLKVFFMKDAKSILLILLSVGMIGTWVYHLYDKSHYSVAKTKPAHVDTTTITDAVKDSLQRLYASAISELREPDSSKSDFDSLKTQLDSRMHEISKLRNEIGSILSNKKISKAELFDAKNKILELRTRIDEMQSKNTTLEEQQQKLNGELNQLNTAMKDLEQNINKLGAENKELKDKINDASTLAASDIRLSFIDVKMAGDSEAETSKAKRANRFVVSFLVQNNIAQFENTEVYVIITTPDGAVVTNEIWESGNFETKRQGSKIYTRKLKFDYTKNEEKRLVFSLDYTNFKKGEYKLKIYHNGVEIGETTKSLG
jgi:predicted  nucleic acid-binding Zn-ribbon protein